MKNLIKNYKLYILILALGLVFLNQSAHAEILDYHLDFDVQRTDGGLLIQRDLDLQRRQTSEIIRGNDLMSKISDFICRTKDALLSLKFRQSDQIRGSELNQIANDNARDAIRRNKLAEQARKRQIKDQMQAIKARNRDLQQRIRDLSRR